MGVNIIGKDVSVVSTILGKAKANISNVGGIGGWAGGGGDVTPNPTPNWVEDGTYAGVTLTEQVTGINQAITLKLSWANASLDSLYAYTGPTNPPTNYIANITSNSTLPVNPNDYVYFGKESYTPSTFIATITVTNVSDNNTVLDTFTIGNLD